MHDYINYIQTVLEPLYTDDQQNDYDYSDEFQGCQSWYEYQQEWN